MIGEIAVDLEVVGDAAAALLSRGGSPGDRRFEHRRLLAREVGGAAIEEDLDRLARGEELEPFEEGEPVVLAGSTQARERPLEADPHLVRGPVADVGDDEQKEAAVEDDVEDHLAVAALVGHAQFLSD